MKSLFTSLILSVTSLTAFADSCYTAKVDVSSSVPSQICLEKAQIDWQNTNLLLEGSQLNIPAILKIKNLQLSENTLSFTAETVLKDEWNDVCGFGEKAVLTISGTVDTGNGLQVDTQGLTLAVDREWTNDSCHSDNQNETINFELVK